MRVAFGEYQLDTETRVLQREGQRIPVQSKAFDLLAYLIERRERVVSSDELLDALWPGLHVTPAALSTAVQKARQAVGDDGEHQTVLHTEHGKGFRFIAEVTDLSEPETTQPKPASFRKRVAVVAGVAALLLGVALIWLSQRQATDRIPGHSLAVLPFADMSADADQEYFADGIAEELLNTLVRFEGLRVVGRTSSFSFRDSDADLKTIGERLGVDVILEGSVRMAGDRVRITAQLVDAKDGFHRWSETYDRELDDIFAIQTEIATAIATALRVNLSSEQHERLATPPTQNLEAYQAYLLGKRRLAGDTTTATVEAIGFFEQAIDLDPEFALAYVGLAYCFINEGDSTGLPPKVMLARARAAANKALALDGRLGEAHAALGSVKWLENDFAGAEAAFQRALALSPNSSEVFSDYGNLLGFELSRYEEALALTKKAVELDPLSVAAIQQVGAILLLLGRFNESQTWYELALEVDPDYAETYWQTSIHHWFVTGRIDEALIAHRKGLIIDPNAWSYAIYGWLWLELGDPDEAEHWISSAYEMGPEEYYPNNALQALALFRGDDAVARVYGEKVYEIDPRDELTLAYLTDRKIREGRAAEARALYEEHYPELLREGDPRVDRHNVRNAIGLALVLDRLGDREQSELLRERSLEALRSWPRVGIRGSRFHTARIHAQRGEKQKALSELRQDIDAGWRVAWWYILNHDPSLESLHDELEFQAMISEIEADMAVQLARVREMERNGELEPIPEVSATTH